MFDPRLGVAGQAAIRQRIGFRKTTSIPSRISGMKPEAPDAVLGRGSGSGFVIEASASAERKNETAPTAIGIDACDQSQCREGEKLERREDPNLERAGMEDEDRDGGDREHRYLASEHADAFAGPELEEIGMAP